MRKDESNKKEVLDKFRQFVHSFRRPPSLGELSDALGWKKSVLRRVVEKLIADGRMKYDLTPDGRVVYKSLQIV